MALYPRASLLVSADAGAADLVDCGIFARIYDIEGSAERARGD